MVAARRTGFVPEFLPDSERLEIPALGRAEVAPLFSEFAELVR
jgi:hypothetical protein